MKEKPKTRRFGPKKLITKYCCPGKSTEGAKEHRRGCFPPAPDRREEPPGHDSLTIISPEGATEYVTCIITTCLCLCRPFRAFSFVATLPGVLPFGQAQAESTPVCGLSSLRDFWQAAMRCYSSERPIEKDLKGRERIFPGQR